MKKAKANHVMIYTTQDQADAIRNSAVKYLSVHWMVKS
jgi:hypothetical protein